MDPHIDMLRRLGMQVVPARQRKTTPAAAFADHAFPHNAETCTWVVTWPAPDNYVTRFRGLGRLRQWIYDSSDSEYSTYLALQRFGEMLDQADSSLFNEFRQWFDQDMISERVVALRRELHKINCAVATVPAREDIDFLEELLACRVGQEYLLLDGRLEVEFKRQCPQLDDEA